MKKTKQPLRRALTLTLAFASAVLAVAQLCFAATSVSQSKEKYGPAAAIEFARHYQGNAYAPDVLHCYPEAKGIPFSDTENIIPMTASLWTPQQLTQDFRERMAKLPENQ